jgi:hypothetical protein
MSYDVNKNHFMVYCGDIDPAKKAGAGMPPV